MSELNKKNEPAEPTAEEQVVNNTAEVTDDELDEVSGARSVAMYGIPDPT
jgi:hypothetical protein